MATKNKMTTDTLVFLSSIRTPNFRHTHPGTTLVACRILFQILDLYVVFIILCTPIKNGAARFMKGTK